MFYKKNSIVSDISTVPLKYVGFYLPLIFYQGNMSLFFFERKKIDILLTIIFPDSHTLFVTESVFNKYFEQKYLK